MEEPDEIKRQLHLLLTAYGYNLYDSANRARADDLLVRERAGKRLSEAVDLLTRLATDFHARCLPPSTRDQPFPPADKMADLKAIQTLREDLSRLGSRLRGMAVPTEDKTWVKFRDEKEVLDRLLRYDYALISLADAVLQSVEPLTPEDWTITQAASVRAPLHLLEQAIHDRERLLQNI